MCEGCASNCHYDVCNGSLAGYSALVYLKNNNKLYKLKK